MILNGNPEVRKEKVAPVMLSLIQQPDSSGILKAMAYEWLGQYYLAKNQIEKSRSAYKNMNSLRDWTVIGPFENTSASGYAKIFPPELEYSSEATYHGEGGVPATWFPIRAVRNDYWIDFTRYFAFESGVYYGNCFIYSPQRQSVQLRVGTSGSLKVFLNDNKLFECSDESNNDLDTYVLGTELQQGWNRLLIKCGYSEISSCNFMVRITDEHGEAITGLKESVDLKEYPRHTGAPVRVIPNFSESYFGKKIQDEPGNLENYIYLAKAFQRNEKSDDAENILLSLQRKMPNSALPYFHLAQTYYRNHRSDEAATAFEKLYQLDRSIPAGLAYHAAVAIGHEQYDEAESSIRAMEALGSQSQIQYATSIALYRKRDDQVRVKEMLQEAYKRYPTVWSYVDGVASQENGQKSVSIYQKYLDLNFGTLGLRGLADAYKRMKDDARWESTYMKIFKVDSASVASYANGAKIFLDLKNTKAADRMIKKGIEICPNSSPQWMVQGNIYRSQGRIEDAKSAYRQALRYLPTNYTAQSLLRELNGKNSAFAQFQQYSIDSLIKESRQSPVDTSGNPVIVLLRDDQRVVYPEGGSEAQMIILLKMLNSKGLDQNKEMRIPYNEHFQDLIIEEAVTIKENGSRVKADVEKNQVVFKSAEPNDYFYLKWDIRDSYSGELARHFWDNFIFGGYYPVAISRYSLLIPDTMKFHFDLRNITREPERQPTEDGIIYSWTILDEPAIQPELNMLPTVDVVKTISVSNISDWSYLVDWYSNLTKAKTRSSWEIKEVLAKLFSGMRNPTRDEKISTIHKFITKYIRYSNVPFRDAEWVPKSAREVLTTRLGDCKDKATLAISMLAECGIPAHYVLVQTWDEGKNKNVVPAVSAFNHCIVGISDSGLTRYIDFTAENYPVNTLPTMDIGSFALSIDSVSKEPFYIPVPVVKTGVIKREGTMEILPSNAVKVSIATKKYGEFGVGMRYTYAGKNQEQSEKALTEILGKDFAQFKLTGLTMGNKDDPTPDFSYSFDYEVQDYLVQSDDLAMFKIPWDDSFAPAEMLSYKQRKYPLWVTLGDTLIETIRISLPPNYTAKELPQRVHYVSPQAEYTVLYDVSKTSILARREFISYQKAISPEEYAEFKTLYSNIMKEDSRQIVLVKK
jgi:tetratricopeptide (TPR) repeat protein